MTIKLDDDVNWKFVDIPFLRDSGRLMISGEFEVPKRAVNYPRNAFSALESTAEQVGGLVRATNNTIKVMPKLSEEFYVIHFDYEDDFKKITIHQPTSDGENDMIGELTMEDLEKRRDVTNEIQKNMEFRGIYDDEWKDGEGADELLDKLYPRSEMSGSGNYVEIDYKSDRSGDTKTKKGEVLEIDDHGNYVVATINREDGDKHHLVIDVDAGLVTLHTVKEKETRNLGRVEKVLTIQSYRTPEWER